MSFGIGRRHGSDLVLLWLWRRPVAIVLIRPLDLEPPYALTAALKRHTHTHTKKTKTKQTNKKTGSLIPCVCQFPRSKRFHHGQFQPSNTEHRVGKRDSCSALRAKLSLAHLSWRSQATISLALATASTPFCSQENSARAVATEQCSTPHIFQAARILIFYCGKELELGSW